MGAIASQITSLTIVYSIVYSDADQREHQSSALLAFVWGIHRRPVNSQHKWPVTRKMFPFDDVITVLFEVNPLSFRCLQAGIPTTMGWLEGGEVLNDDCCSNVHFTDDCLIVSPIR